MKYRQNPHDPDELQVEASPAEVHAIRGAIFGYLARWGAPSRDREDLVQWVEVLTWQGLEKGRVRGSIDRSPKAALLCFMVAAAWNLWQNQRRRCSTQNELLLFEDDPIEAQTPDWVDKIEARDLLQRIATRSRTARSLLLAALEVSLPERSADTGLPPSTYSGHLAQTRRWVRKLHASGKWHEPPAQPNPRKRK